MKDILTYVIGVVVCSGLFVVFYRTMLHQRTSFRTARVFLLGSLVIAAIIPAFNIPVWETEPIEIPLFFADTPAYTSDAPPATAAPVDYWQTALWIVYALGIGALLSVMARQAVKILRTRRRSQIYEARGYKVAVSEEVDAPFSFLSTVYLEKGTPPDEMRQILLHETSHIRHRHSAEKIVMEILKTLMWFNPVAWIASRLLNEVHEFEADRDVLQQGCTVEEYLPVIFKQVFGYIPEISTGLANSLTKKRFEMMTRKLKHGRYSWLRTAGVLPIAGGMLMLFGFTERTPEIVMTGLEESFAATARQEPQKDVPSYFADKMPVFQEGDIATFRTWVQSQLQYPRVAQEKNVQGKVTVRFVIEKDGTLTNIEEIGSPDRSLTEETIRVLKQSPGWTPGMQGGKAVRIYYVMPVDFVLAGAEKTEQPSATGVQGAMEELKDVGSGQAETVRSISINAESGLPEVTIKQNETTEKFNAIYWLANENRELKADEFSKIIPADIEAMEVLKNPSSVASFKDATGDRKVDGVIVITLKDNTVAAVTFEKNPFIWMAKEKREITMEEMKGLEPDTISSIDKYVDSQFSAELKQAMGSRRFLTAAVITTK